MFEGALAIRLIIARDFAVTRSSPESCCDFFAIASEQTVELKWPKVKQAQQLIPFVTCEVSFGQNVGTIGFWCRCT